MWGDDPHDYVDPHVGDHLAPLRSLIFTGKIDAAERLSSKMMGNPPVLMPYQPFCDLHLLLGPPGDVSNYRRDLNLNDATASVSYRADGVQYHRAMFISHPDQVMVLP